MYFSSYGPLKFTLKSAQNAKFAVNHTLRWNNSNLITNWETILTLNNYMGEMNSEIISRFQVMYLSSYGPLKFTLKSAQNAKFAVNHTLRWNNSNLITNWETILTLNNYMGEMNSEIISRFQVSQIRT